MKYSLGIDALPVAEVNLLKTILRLSSKLANKWELSESRRCDVLLQDSSVYVGGQSKVSDAQFVVVITRPADQVVAPTSLVRPIKIDEIEILLTDFESSISKSAVNLDSSSLTIKSGHFKLKRWPPQSILGGSLEKIQIATFLSRRPLTMAQLIELSGKSQQTCVAFVKSLDLIGLLQWEVAALAGAVATIPTIPAPAASPGVRGLLRGIRRRLGLS